MDESGTDRPPPSASADIALITRAVTVTASVDDSGDSMLVVRPVADSAALGVTIKPGDLVEVYWAGSAEERALPARVSEVDGGGSPRWHLTVTGPTRRSQRRRAVRVAVELPVAIPWAGGQATGVTEDLSEAGLRARVDGWGLPPDPGAVIHVNVTLDGGEDVVAARGEVLRMQNRGGQWLLSLQFVALPEADQDRLRRRVFASLREQRAAAADDD
jgi:hypothetical protein